MAPLKIVSTRYRMWAYGLRNRVHHSAVSPAGTAGQAWAEAKLHGADGGVGAGVGEHHGVAHFHLGHVRIGKNQIRAGAEVARHGDGLPSPQSPPGDHLEGVITGVDRLPCGDGAIAHEVLQHGHHGGTGKAVQRGAEQHEVLAMGDLLVHHIGDVGTGGANGVTAGLDVVAGLRQLSNSVMSRWVSAPRAVVSKGFYPSRRKEYPCRNPGSQTSRAPESPRMNRTAGTYSDNSPSESQR